MRLSTMFPAIAAASASLAIVSAALAGPVYAPNNFDPLNPGSTAASRLIMFDSTNPAGFTVVGSMGVDNVGFGGMAFDNQARLWAYASYYKSNGGAVSGLYQVNTTTGQATPVGAPPRRFLDDMAFNPSDGKMYGVKTQNNDTYLWSIDLGNGELTEVGVFSGLPERHNVTGLAFDSAGSIYLLENRNFYVEDPNNPSGPPQALDTSGVYKGSGLSVGLLYDLQPYEIWGLVGAQGIDIDWSRDNTGYHNAVGQGVFPDYFSTLNTFFGDGSAYVVGDPFGDNIDNGGFGYPPVQLGDLALMPDPSAIIPEPATAGLVGLGSSLSLLLRRRRR